MIGCTSRYKAKRIVRVGGPTDRFGIQQALDLGADGVMIPLVNTRAEAEQAVSYCYFPPEGQRSAAYPVRAVYPKGVGAPGLARYLQEANREVEVWVQTKTHCLKSLKTGQAAGSRVARPADMGCSLGYHVKHDYHLPTMLASKDLEHVYEKVLKGCAKYGLTPGVFCLGEARAALLAEQGFNCIAYDTDLGAIMNYTATIQSRLKPAVA
eukprot:gene5762-6002_t